MAEAEIIPIEGRARAERDHDPASRIRCRATTSTGRPCRNYAIRGSDYCKLHTSEDVSRSTHPSSPRPEKPERSQPRDESESEAPIEEPRRISPSQEAIEQGNEGGIQDWIRRRLAGDYPVDDFGYDPELARGLLLQLAKPLYENYFRVKTLGIDRIPAEGPALIVANHSGTVALDAVMVQYAVATEHPQKRAIRNIGADLVFQLPFVGPMARKTGNAVACDEDAHELLARGELVGVFPEGYKGVGKGWRERYKLQRFGRGGFMEIALRNRVPIIPVAVVGAEEAYPMIGNAKMLAKAFGFPYFPITPTFPLLGPLGLIPLPSKWRIEFGEPIPMDDYPEDAAEDAMLVFDLADRVRDTIQQMLYRGLNARRGVFF